MTLFEERFWAPRECLLLAPGDAPDDALLGDAPGFPLHVHERTYASCAALYWCLCFAAHPELQTCLCAAPSRALRNLVRRKAPLKPPAWPAHRLDAMRWCLRVKLLQHRPQVEARLRATNARILVETRPDTFWGARPRPDGSLYGANAFGRLLMELRDELATRAAVGPLRPPPLPALSLFRRPLPILTAPTR